MRLWVEHRRSLALLFVLLLPGGCGGRDSSADPATVAVTVRTVSEQSDSQAGVYTASFEPAQQMPVSFQVSGYIDSIKQVPDADGRMRDIQGGDRIQANEILAAVRTDTYQAQVNQARSLLAGAQAELTRTRNDYDRDSQLVRQQVIARATYDAAVQRFQTAQSQVDQQAAALKQAQIYLGYCRLASPISGVIMDRRVEVGELVQPGVAAFQIADTTDMKAVFGVSDMQVSQLKPGQLQALSCEAIPGGHLDGKITRVAPNADPTTRIFDVEVTVPNRDGKIRAGMIASLRINGAAAPTTSVTSLPLNSIVRPPHDPNGFAVYVVENRGGKSIAHLRPVQLGSIAGNEIVATSGVALGDRVIVRGATMVKDGTEVSIIP